MVISPAISLLKTTELPVPRSSVPVRRSPLVKTMTSGVGGGGVACARVDGDAQAKKRTRTSVAGKADAARAGFWRELPENLIGG